MSKYEKLKAKYDNLIRETLASNKKILIESFVDYYGEEYRSIIEKRYNEITFIYYVDWETIHLIVEKFIPQIENPDEYLDFVNLYNSKKTKQTIFAKFFKTMKKKNDLPDNLIGTTNSSILNNDYIKNYLFKIFNSPSPVSFNYGSIMNMDRIISFQILSLSERAIIHEINHSITRDNIAYIIEENKLIGAIHKSGLNIDHAYQNNIEKIIEELINEKASQEIVKIFKEKGGDLSSFCFDIPLAYMYEHNLYLIDEFYDTFKKYIKIARISDNKNALIDRIGKTNYEKYISMVNSCYTEDLSIVDLLKEENQPKIKIIIDKMKNVANNSHDISQQELNDYYDHLKNQGFKVKLLNNISVESNDLSNTDEENVKGR